MMKRKIESIVADESVEYPIIKALRAKNWDVHYIAESDASIPDEQVLQKAVKEQRALLTGDKDFGTLVFKQ